MITTGEAPPWLRRSDQAVTWARTMLTPRRAVVIGLRDNRSAGRRHWQRRRLSEPADSRRTRLLR